MNNTVSHRLLNDPYGITEIANEVTDANIWVDEKGDVIGELDGNGDLIKSSGFNRSIGVNGITPDIDNVLMANEFRFEEFSTPRRLLSQKNSNIILTDGYGGINSWYLTNDAVGAATGESDFSKEWIGIEEGVIAMGSNNSIYISVNSGSQGGIGEVYGRYIQNGNYTALRFGIQVGNYASIEGLHTLNNRFSNRRITTFPFAFPFAMSAPNALFRAGIRNSVALAGRDIDINRTGVTFMREAEIQNGDLTLTNGQINIAAGTTAKAPLKFNAGLTLTTPEDGAFEFDGTELYFTVGGSRLKVKLTP